MENEKLARALAIGSAEAAILRTLVIALIDHHPQRDAIVRAVAQQFGEQQIASAFANHSAMFREELRTQWQMYWPLLDIG